jgi:hypothetical protein
MAAIAKPALAVMGEVLAVGNKALVYGAGIASSREDCRRKRGGQQHGDFCGRTPVLKERKDVYRAGWINPICPAQRSLELRPHRKGVVATGF